jgi:dienelactone hydrolase
MALVVAAFMILCLQATAATSTQAPDATARARAALDLLLADDFAKLAEQFNQKMQAAMPVPRLAATWTQISRGVGPHRRCEQEPRVVEINDKRMVITRCEFERASIDIQFAFDTSGHISGLVFRPVLPAAAPYTPPSYATPASYLEEEVTIGSGEWALPGTLTLPAGTDRSPLVVLVAGSGPNDRDETIGATKPFKDLAVGLASRGIAVLRYDKRPHVYGARMAGLTRFTVREAVVDDVVEAVKVAGTHARIDPSRVFVLGHSLGGSLVPRIAASTPSVAGFIVAAGAARPLHEAMVEQVQYVAAADGTISPEERETLDRTRELAEAVHALRAGDAEAGRRVGNLPASYWLDLRGYDAPIAARHVRAPMLILQGERDYQVTMKEYERWRSALAGRADVTFRSYPALNHLFIAGTGPSLPAEYLRAGHVDQPVIADIVEWIRGARR